MTRSKLYFVNRFFYPDFSATSQMLTELATVLAVDHDVTVITSRTLYNDPLAKLACRDEYRGVKILRINTTRVGRHSLRGRVLDYASFSIRVFAFLLRYVRRGDVVVLKTDPPLLSLANTVAVRLRGGRVVNWLQDLFPEIAVELGAFPRNRLITGPLTWWRNRTLRAARANVVISQRMKDFLAGQGVTNTVVIPNWADGELITPLPHAENRLRAEWNPEGRFLVGYSGNFGRAHTFSELLDAMTLLDRREEIHFVLIGEGAGLGTLVEAVAHKRLRRVSFQPYQPLDMLRQSLGAIDLHVVTLKERMEGLVFPSKIYGALAAGRPIAFVGDADGEIANLIRDHEVGFAVQHGDGVGLADMICRVFRDSGPARQMGRNARDLFNLRYRKALGCLAWEQVIERVVPAAQTERISPL